MKNNKNSNLKTNAMRILDKEKIKYVEHDFFPLSDFEDIGYEVISERTGVPMNKIFKTIVTIGATGTYYIFVVQGIEELNLKKAAISVNEKNIELINLRDLEKITGYIRGGCSPVGMKKLFKTVYDDNVRNFDTIMVSAGKRGYQIELNPLDLVNVTKGIISDIKSDTKAIFN